MKVSDLGFTYPKSWNLEVTDDNGNEISVHVGQNNGKWSGMVFNSNVDYETTQKIVKFVEEGLESGEIKVPSFIPFDVNMGNVETESIEWN
jgi:hypothetical protein